MSLKQQIYVILKEEDSKLNLFGKIVNWGIIFLIILSSVAILLEVSFKKNEYIPIFNFIELFTTIIFSIEYLLRIWIANTNLNGSNGFKARLGYVFSFYGLIDAISILPFYSGIFIGKQNFGFIKIIRIVRLLRLARYLKSFDFIINATKNKKSELFISMQIVLLFTFVLSVLLFFVENKVQPENFSSVTDALIWSFSKYIGDIAGYGDFMPLTVGGKILATAVGILSIAIFAVPAGIVASGFVEEIEAEKKLNEVSKTQMLIERSFLPNMNQVLGIRVPPRKRSIPQIQARLTLTEPEIFEAVRNSDHLRIIWDKSDPKSQNFDLIVVENKIFNTHFGYEDVSIESNIRLINPLGKGERAISHFCQSLSQLGKYQIVSNEVFSGGDFEPETKHRLDISEAYSNEEIFEQLPTAAKAFCNSCIDGVAKDNWIIVFRSSASHRDLHFHITFGGDKGELKFEDITSPTVHNSEMLSIFLNELAIQMKAINLNLGTHEDFRSTNQNLLHQYIHKNTQANVITIFVSIDLLSGPDRIYYNVLKNLNIALQKLS